MHRIIKIVALAALALLATAAVASASVTVNPGGTTSIGKGDVQTALGLNDAAVQTAPVTFGYWTDRYYPWSWTCTNGDSFSGGAFYRDSYTVENVQRITNPNGKLIGWTVGKPVGDPVLTKTGPIPGGTPLLTCPTGGSVDWASVVFPTTDTPTPGPHGLSVNGIELP
jgi:hypothetical protein